MTRVLTGLDRLRRNDQGARRSVAGRKVGLLAHAASVDGQLTHALDVIEASGGEVVALFGPEHGFDASAQDMVGVAGDEKLNTQRPVYSLYGQDAASLAPKPQWLEGLDAVVVDLQDVGSRYYTYVWTAALMLQAAARKKIEVWVLDRPNPIGGVDIEGAPQHSGYCSFVGLYPVAVRHAMTIGELLRLVARRERLDEGCLSVVSMEGWHRSMHFPETGLPWVLPSPNMPTYDTALVYPGGCLLEGTNLSEGRGTTRPFETWGAPFVQGEALARDVQTDGATLRPLSFKPGFQKHAGVMCKGVQVHVRDRHRFRPYAAYLRWIHAARQLSPKEFQWRTEPYEFVEDRPAIDLLTGSPHFRQLVDEGQALDELLQGEERELESFKEERQQVLLY